MSSSSSSSSDEKDKGCNNTKFLTSYYSSPFGEDFFQPTPKWRQGAFSKIETKKTGKDIVLSEGTKLEKDS
ncbi:hypothetical protein TNCV_4383601 [Trichonephila clavipes]|nr:hypothetical protein TNCV_4383601 [Trichonephila clavipes]